MTNGGPESPRRRKDDAPMPQGGVDAPAPDAASDDAATWGGEGGGGDYPGGPAYSTGKHEPEDSGGNPEVM
jgi:hypothetical protein